MQPPPFYSEFRLDRREYTCICMCACILAMHTCPCACIPVSVSTRFSLRREFVTASRLFAVSPSHFIPLVSAYPASLSSFLRQVYRDPILLFLSLSLSTYCYPGMHRKSPVHVYPLHVVVYLLDQFTLGAPFRRTQSQAWRDTHTYIDPAVPLANYFCLASLKITSLQVRERGQRNDFLSLDENYL